MLRRRGHPAHVQILETHIAYVLLTGVYAYKIKKAVDLGFLDFTDPQARRFFCEEELRLNRRCAPEAHVPAPRRQRRRYRACLANARVPARRAGR